MRRLSLVFVGVVCLLAAAGIAWADTVSLTSVKDVAIYEEDDLAANGGGAYIFAGNNTG